MSGPAPSQKCSICGTECRSWRECPRPACAKKVARCDAHGGDDEAKRVIITHIKGHP